VERRLNEERLLDYWVEEFDRIDEVGTIYQGISRLPAGHAMAATQQGLKVWRWWDPAQLSERKFASMDECAEAFLEQLREVVKCRLRSIKPVGAMLSGGLDSSTLVGLISKEFRGELAQPLRTFSMANADRDICLDWQCVQSITQADPWLQSTVITSDQMDQAWQSFVDGIVQADEPIDALYGWTYDCMHRAAGEAGCGSLFDGMAGDLLFHSPRASIHALASSGQWLRIPGVLLQLQRMGWSVKGVLGSEVSAWVTGNLPTGLLDKVRSWKDARAAARGDLGYLHPEVARQLVQDRNGVIRRRSDAIRHANDQQRHAANFKSGLISFAHESRTTSLLRYGVEPRSPYSDRRMMEFAVAMPMQAKLAHPWYKYLLRQVAQAYLPHHVVWRKKVGYHPGWSFHTRLAAQVISQEPLCRDAVYSSQVLKRWVRPERLAHAWGMYKNNKSDDSVAPILNAYVLSTWLKCKNV
jgi:asparagine synthase (glutamine-hydrolysing)